MKCEADEHVDQVLRLNDMIMLSANTLAEDIEIHMEGLKYYDGDGKTKVSMSHSYSQSGVSKTHLQERISLLRKDLLKLSKMMDK